MVGGSRSGEDLVLGGRHLVGIFAVLVIVLGVVFTLGYLLGRSRYEEELRAFRDAAAGGTAMAGVNPRGSAAGSARGSAPAPTAPAEWDFYRAGQPAETPQRLEAPEPARGPAAAPAETSAKPEPKPAARPPAQQPAVRPAPAAATRPTPASTASPSNSALIPTGAITLQVAALLNQPDALALAQALQDKKFPALVTTPTADRYYRVRVGPYSDMQEATVARRELERQGFKPIVRR
jgi:cell division septation protein DedD